MLSGGDARTFDFDTDRIVRNGFIRKVYGIVGSQFLLTSLVAGAIMKAGESYLREDQSLTLGLLVTSMVLSIGTMCIFCCAPQLMRRFPHNYIILFLFTVAESIVVGLICVQYSVPSVLVTFGFTTVVVFALTLFACQTKVDFTGCGPYLFVGIICLSMMGFFMWLGSIFLSGAAMQSLNLLYACGGALLFSFYIVYDTQLIVGGKHHRSNEFGLDDYAFAAISLYLDIVQLFLFLLRIFGQRR
mmetsp:Transcript_23604/g.45100  ORF Transcript_23604/g.45100 Transcript_23604/m.45100 type:complete len:244 (-) Transcript_23604:126-857(-)